MGESEFKYIWRWGKSKWAPFGYPLAEYKGARCRVLARGKLNSCLLEFEDGFKTITSRNGLKKA